MLNANYFYLFLLKSFESLESFKSLNSSYPFYHKPLYFALSFQL